jgi:four helix bundle protein
MAKHFRELQCWQLANELRSEVHAVCAIEKVKRDLNFCYSFRKTASSVCRNIAEGFGRYDSCVIVQFFQYALGSLAEVQDHLLECQTANFIDSPRFLRLWDLSEHTKATTRNFMRPHQKRCSQQKRHKVRP